MTTRPRTSIATERDEMKTLAAYLDAKRILWFHPFNEARRTPHLGRMLKAQGLKSGIPDCMIIDPPPKFLMFHGTALELKRTKGGRISDAQARWIVDLNLRGWVAMVCYGAGHAIKELERLGY